MLYRNEATLILPVFLYSKIFSVGERHPAGVHLGMRREKKITSMAFYFLYHYNKRRGSPLSSPQNPLLLIKKQINPEHIVILSDRSACLAMLVLGF